MRHGWLALVVCIACFAAPAAAQTFTISLDSSEFVTTPTFSDVQTFSIDIVVQGDLASGTYNNPPLESVTYSVSGDLAVGTPSTFDAFALVRDIPGADFYAQGSLLIFEVAPTAVLTDGLQLAELAGTTLVFTFNGREIGNGRFHPALLTLNADGTGTIQNSNNIIQQNPLQQVDFGEEYVTSLMFDPGNLTLVDAEPVPPTTLGGSSGGGAVSLVFFATLWLAVMHAAMRRRWAIAEKRA